MMLLMGQSTHRGGDSKDVRVAGQGGIATGEVGYPLQAITHGIWMNEQLAGAGLDRAA
jgi:hypothetical protein